HVANGFRISILTEEDFAVEVQLLANLRVYQFDLAAPPVSPAALAQWMEDESKLELVANLSRKAAFIGGGKSQERKALFQARMVPNYIQGNTLLSRLQQELPETYAKVIEYKVSREANLEAETFSTTRVPADFLESTLVDYRSELIELPGISRRVANALAHEA